MNRYRAVLAVLVSLFLLGMIYIVGCNDKKTVQPKDNNNLASSAQQDNLQQEQGRDPFMTLPGDQKEAAGSADTKTIRETLYYGDDQGENLIPEIRQVAQADDMAKAVIEELIKGPRQGEAVVATIPHDTKLLGMEIRDGIANVNFSKELISNHQGGSAGEIMTVFSIVNTLTEFDNIEQVQILVDGKKVESLAGHMDTSTPLTRDETLISSAKQ